MVTISSAAATTTAAVAASAAIATAITATAIAATRPISARASFVNGEIATVEVFPIELFDGRSRFFGRCHLDKAESSRASSHAILDHLGRFNVARFGKVIFQVITGRLEREISYIKFRSHCLS